MVSKTHDLNTKTLSLDVSRLTEQAKRELLDFYQFLLQRYEAQPVSKFPPSQLEPPDTPSVYKGPPLSLEEMERAINIEAGKHR
jgi:hypothetical protein